MPKYRQLSNEEEQEIIKLYEINTLRMTAIKFKTSPELVSKVLTKYNIPEHTKEEISQIKKHNHLAAWEAKSKEEQIAHKKRCGVGIKAAWANKSEEEMLAFSKVRSAIEQNKTPEEKQIILEKQIKTQKANWQQKSEEEKAAHAKKTSEGLRSRSEEAKQESTRKRRETTYKNYGVLNPLQSPEIQKKRYNTMRRNSTFNSSKPEELVYKLLCEKYTQSDIVRQYKEMRYPFHCDFYIKSLDLFIELNDFWTHGEKPFEETSEDLAVLEFWQAQLEGPYAKFYKNAIQNWTIRDVKKFTTAKNNGLHYIAIYHNEYDKLEKGEITIDEILKTA